MMDLMIAILSHQFGLIDGSGGSGRKYKIISSSPIARLLPKRSTFIFYIEDLTAGKKFDRRWHLGSSYQTQTQIIDICCNA